jgi:hypothetical protein
MATTHLDSVGFTRLAAGGVAGSTEPGKSTIPQILVGSGLPTIVAPRGSIYLRSDGTPYVNTDGATTWAAIGSATPQGLATTDSPTFANLTDSGLTASQVVFAGVAGLLSGDAHLIWDNTAKVLRILSGATLDMPAGSHLTVEDYIEVTEIGADPAAPAATKARLYTKDNAGKVNLVVRFPTGAVQLVAAEP